jgi:hypothetical protein
LKFKEVSIGIGQAFCGYRHHWQLFEFRNSTVCIFKKKNNSSHDGVNVPNNIICYNMGSISTNIGSFLCDKKCQNESKISGRRN